MRRDPIDEFLLVIHPPAALHLLDSKTTARGWMIATYVLANGL